MGFQSRAALARDFFIRLRATGRRRWSDLLGFSLTLLHEGVLGCAGKLLAVRTDRFDFTGGLDVGLAFLHKGRLGGPGQRLAVFAEGFGFTPGKALGKRGGGKEGEHERSDQLHDGFLSRVRKTMNE